MIWPSQTSPASPPASPPASRASTPPHSSTAWLSFFLVPDYTAFSLVFEPADTRFPLSARLPDTTFRLPRIRFRKHLFQKASLPLPDNRRASTLFPAERIHPHFSPEFYGPTVLTGALGTRVHFAMGCKAALKRK